MSEDTFDLDSLDIGDLDFDATDTDAAREIEDDGKRGLKFAFIGAGQCGNNICSTLWEHGYRRVVLFNTTEKDLRINSVPQAWHVVADGYDGAGKDRSVGKQAALSSAQKILELMGKRFFGADFIFVCTSAGGGTGSGSAKALADMAKSWLIQTLNISKEEAAKRVGIIAALPKQQEGTAASENAKAFIADFVDTDTGVTLGHSPLFFIDNARAERPLLKVKVPLVAINHAINKVLVQLFDMFNITSARSSDMYTLDSKDYSGILSSGIVTIGASRIRRVETDSDIARALRSNLSQTVLVDGLDISTGTHAALVINGGDSVIDSITPASIDAAQEMLNTLLGGHTGSKKVTLHLGVYRQEREQIDIMSIVGGLAFPTSRFK